jgi:hypothetical protein
MNLWIFIIKIEIFSKIEILNCEKNPLNKKPN